jgi:hypothetical protein
MSDLANERQIGLRGAAKLIPSYREGKPTHVSTILRWITKGVRLSNGERVRLEGARLGGRWITSIEALGRFSERLTAGALSTIPDEGGYRPAVEASRRRRELDRVDRRLADAGF